jgi:hypothetical protein
MHVMEDRLPYCDVEGEACVNRPQCWDVYMIKSNSNKTCMFILKSPPPPSSSLPPLSCSACRLGF